MGGATISYDDATFLKHIGQRLRTEREHQRYSQADIADMIGVHQTAFSLMERGRQNIPLPTYLSWCDALGVEPWQLLV